MIFSSQSGSRRHRSSTPLHRIPSGQRTEITRRCCDDPRTLPAEGEVSCLSQRSGIHRNRDFPTAHRHCGFRIARRAWWTIFRLEVTDRSPFSPDDPKAAVIASARRSVPAAPGGLILWWISMIRKPAPHGPPELPLLGDPESYSVSEAASPIRAIGRSKTFRCEAYPGPSPQPMVLTHRFLLAIRNPRMSLCPTGLKQQRKALRK
jgi:hypothetical protein